MATLRLYDNENFTLILRGSDEFIGRETPVPSTPFAPQGTYEVHGMVSEEEQEVKVDYSQAITDSNNIEYPLIVGGRPKSRRRT